MSGQASVWVSISYFEWTPGTYANKQANKTLKTFASKIDISKFYTDDQICFLLPILFYWSISFP